jgi:outer membrane immunogenic protein
MQRCRSACVARRPIAGDALGRPDRSGFPVSVSSIDAGCRAGPDGDHHAVNQRTDGRGQMKLKTFGACLAALAWLAISLPAEAADMQRVYKGPPRPVANFSNWTGFYLGINGGYGWGRSNWDYPSGSSSPSGWLLGITAGFNYQINNFVLGIEGDLDWADINAGGVCAAVACNIKSTYLATIRGRIGYNLDRFLPYITGGAAFAKVSADAPSLALAASSNRTGWTIGGGIEYAFTGAWSAKLEYLYVDLGNFDSGFLTPTVANISFKESIFRVGLNYHFSAAAPLMSRY